ncbi:MAG: xylulokinase [Planctomycetes bacterium]|nr:xylulokinase [Planctomycetota bacterium]
MQRDDLTLGIDVGTSGAKALIVDDRGAVRAEATTEYPLLTPKPLWAEQDPRQWWSATLESVQRVLATEGVSARKIAAVGLTGQMHGLVLLDVGGEVLRPAILWNDQRTGEQCRAITAAVGADRVLALTGNPVLAGFTAPKIAWVRQHEPQVFSRIAKVLLPKDYVRYRFSGAFFGDVSDASGMSLFDVGRRCWSSEMLAAVGVPAAWLPEITESTVPSARVSAAAAKACGLLEGTPIVAGAGDQAAQAVGCGITEEGLVSATLGTSGVVFAASDSYRVDPLGRLHAFCHAVPGKWHLMGVMLSAAGSFRWFRDALCEPEHAAARAANRDAYDDLTAAAARIAPGSEGLLFLPYLTGERTPHPDPLARGAFVGLTLRHTKAHLTRSVLEGVAFGLCDSLDLMRELGIRPRQVRASGGGARSELWRRILADVFDTEIATPSVAQGAAYGAALLAGVGVGVFADFAQACRAASQVGDVTRPGPAAPQYRRFQALYRSLYPALRGCFSEAAKVCCG